MTAAERKYEEGRRAGLLEAENLLAQLTGEAEAGRRECDFNTTGGALRFALEQLRALAGPAQARLDGGEDCPAGYPPQEVAVRVDIVLRSHLSAREKFFTDPAEAGGRGSTYHEPTAAALAEARKEIRAALIRHGETNGDREKWRRESAVLAAGVGIFYSAPHNGELETERAKKEAGSRPLLQSWRPKLYLELWRPWKLQKGKPDPVLRYAEKCFERRREVAGGR